MTHGKMNRRGFTITEMLIVLLILMMVTMLLAAGIPLASRAYKKVVDASNAQLLLSTTMTELRDELSFASDVSVSGGVISFKAADGSSSTISCKPDGIYLHEHIEFDTDGSYDRLLVSDKAATSGLAASWSSVSCSGGVVTVNGLSVSKDGTELLHVSAFKIKAGK